MLPFSNTALLINALLRTIIATLILLICFSYTRRRFKLNVYKRMALFFLALVFWDYLSALYYITPDVASLPLLDNLIHISVTISVYTFFIFCATCYNDFKEIPYAIRFTLRIFPILNAVILLTYPFHNFGLVDCIHYNYDTPFRINNYNWGFWFYLNIAYLNVLTLLGTVLLWAKYLKKGSSNRKTYLFLALFATTAPFSSIVTTYSGNEIYQFVTCFFHCFCPLGFFLILMKDQKLTLEYLKRIEIQTDEDLPTVLLNNKEEVVLFNKAAERFFAKYNQKIVEGVTIQEIIYPTLMVRLGSEKPIKNHEIIYLQNKKTRELVIVKKKFLVNKKNQQLGTSATFEFVQVLDQIIEHLEKYAFYDALCHCNTRALYEKHNPTLLREAQYPVCFFVADVDNLKTVNDHFGHKTGDLYIQKCSEILQECFPAQCHFYRIGGDEFFIFCSNTDKAETEKILKCINKKCKSQTGLHCFNISVGYSILTSAPLPSQMQEVFNQHFKQADQIMYKNKRKHTKQCRI